MSESLVERGKSLNAKLSDLTVAGWAVAFGLVLTCIVLAVAIVGIVEFLTSTETASMVGRLLSLPVIAISAGLFIALRRVCASYGIVLVRNECK